MGGVTTHWDMCIVYVLEKRNVRATKTVENQAEAMYIPFKTHNNNVALGTAKQHC